MKKKLSGITKIASILLTAVLLLTGCGQPTNGDANDSTKGNSTISVGDKGDNTAMGRYVQKDITPPNVKNASLNQFTQKSDGTIVLSIFDTDEKKPRGFILKGEEWEEQDNKIIADFVAEQKPISIKTCYDYDGSWWVALYGEDMTYHIYKIAKDGTAAEIVVPYITDAAAAGEELSITGIQSNENGKLCVSILNIKVAAAWVIIDTVENKVIQTIIPSVPDYTPYLKGDKLYARDSSAKMMNCYDIISGERTDSFPISVDVIDNFSIDEKTQVVYTDMDGIHQFALNGSITQTVVDNHGFIYASPSSQRLYVIPGKDNTYFIACEEQGKLNIYYYAVDKTLPTAFEEKLFVWAMEDSFTLRGAIIAFSVQNPNCEVVLEFGKTDDTAIIDADIIKSLNTRLLAGEAPDILMLDGLPITELIEQGLLSPLESIVNEDDYRKNILNCYQKDGKSYAYPTTFQIPVIISSSDKYNIEDFKELAQVSELYKDKAAIENIAYSDIFESMYNAMSHKIFKDGKALDEAALREFLTQTKAMVDAQGITEENVDYLLSSGNAKGMVEVRPSPSILAFRNGRVPYATGIIDSMSTSAVMFVSQSNIKITPIPGNGFIPLHISSIPTDAANKDGAKAFIKLLLSETVTQVTGMDSGFSVHKSIEKDMIKDLVKRAEENNMIMKTDPVEFDWEGLINKLQAPCNSEEFLRSTVYDQAQMLYINEIDINTAVSRIVDQTRLYFAERQ